MTTPSTVERNLLNTHPQQTQLYLSVFRPSVALICQVDGSYDAETQSVSYDNVVTGSYTNITDFFYQVALIGTNPGQDDYGRTWVRSATNSTLRFVESDHINWSDNLYVTVLKYTEIIPVFPRIIKNPANDEDVIFYKVWDVAYTDQNSILGSFICMGSHAAAFRDAGSASVYWSASGTTNLIGDTLTYAWTFEGGSPASSASHTPGNVTYSTPGHYRTILEVTSTSGRVDKSIRYVSIYDRPGEGPNTPIMNWEMIEFGGSRDGVGYTTRVRIRDVFEKDDPTTADAYIDGALVVIFKEDWYGNTKQSINRNAKGRENIFFVGYINGGTIQFDYRDNSLEFDVISPTNLMEITECFSVSVESKPVPTVWYELKDMDVRRAVYHYLAWHSSVTLVCDIEAKNLDDRNIQYFDADRTSLYDAINTVVNGALRGRVMSDSLGKLWMERDYSVIDSASTTLSVAYTFSKADFVERPNIEERQIQDVSFIEWGGIAYNPVSGQSTALLASAPGTAPGYRGKVERSQGFALQDQTDLNTMVGNAYASMNSRYPTMDAKLRGNFPCFDIAPQEIVRVNLSASDTPRHVTFSNKPFVIRGVSASWDSRNQVLLTSLQLAEITQGFVGSSIVIPIEPPTVENGGGSVQQPPITVPPIPTPAPVTSSGTAVNVWENGVFKITTDTLNFIGSIVRVFPNTTDGRADIYFDACGCSGTFNPSPPGSFVGSIDHTANADSNPSGTVPFHPAHYITNSIWYLKDYQPLQYTSLVDPDGCFDNMDADATVTFPFTDMYALAATIRLSNLIYQKAPGDYEIEYNLTIHFGTAEATVSGTYNSAGRPVEDIFTQTLNDGSHYFQSGEKTDIWIEGSVTDLSGKIYDNAILGFSAEITINRAT